MHKYIIMGPQGSGKGTQAERLAEDFDLVHISVGDIFRWNIQAHTKLAARIQRIIDNGHLVPDEIVEDIVRQRLADHDWNFGFILDGFPRNPAQAVFFLESYDVDAVIYIDVPDQVVMDRAMARRKCTGCGLDYNLIHHRPKVEGICDVCGSPLAARADDNHQALAKRLHTFNTQTKPTLDKFDRKELVVRVDGTGSIDDVQSQIRSALNLNTDPDPSTKAIPAPVLPPINATAAASPAPAPR
ncbi:MAG: nucleoside monophosphate kinase [Planctomycetota bacterium]